MVKITSIEKFNQKWIKLIVVSLRIIIGAVFVFSGFVKAIDPWGSIYKFGDYLSAFGASGFEPFLLFMALSLAAFEFIFGVLILFGCYRKVAPTLLLLMMAVMLPLTLYIAITDSVGDCGCFGDAIVISNWATFWKNVFITLGLIYLQRYNKSFKNIYGVSVQWIVILFTFIYIIIISFIGYIYQPLIDFRPYKVGSSIVDRTTNSDNDLADNYVFIYEKNGVKKEFSADSIPDDESWTFVDRKELKPINIPQNTGISIYQDGEDLTNEVLPQTGEIILLTFPNLSQVDISYTYMINEICDYAKAHGIIVNGLAATTQENIDQWNDLSMASYKLYTIDDSILKSIVRGNPGIVYIKDGIIEWKQTLQSISNETMLHNADSFTQLIGGEENDIILAKINLAYIISMILLLIINRSHIVIKLKFISNKKNEIKDVNLQNEK